MYHLCFCLLSRWGGLDFPIETVYQQTDAGNSLLSSKAAGTCKKPFNTNLNGFILAGFLGWGFKLWINFTRKAVGHPHDIWIIGGIGIMIKLYTVAGAGVSGISHRDGITAQPFVRFGMAVGKIKRTGVSMISRRAIHPL